MVQKINEMYSGVLTATHMNSTTATEAQIQTKELLSTILNFPS